MTTTIDIDEEALRWFVVLRDEAAPVDAWLAFQDWLEADDAHRAAYDAVEATWVRLDDAAGSAANDVPPGNVVPLRPASRRTPRPSGLRWALPSLAAAAVAVLAVGLWAPWSVSAVTYRTGDQPREIVLADGSRLLLNRRSELSARVRASGGLRRVDLAEGEAAFDVVHDAARPFVVTAGDRRVEVLGTAFDVVRHRGRFTVGVARGAVSVKAARAATPVRLVAGQALAQSGDAAPVLSRIDPAGVSAWRNGTLIYRDRPLAEVADDLSRYLGKPVMVSPDAQGLRFTGALRVGDEATMLGQLQDFVPIGVDRSATGVRLTMREGR